MNSVEPIREIKKVAAMKRILKRKSLRDYTLFVFAINSALRISDVLATQIRDVVDTRGNIRTHYTLRETKTKKGKRFAFSRNVREALREYIRSLDSYNLDDYLFKSRKGANRPISRQQAYKIINCAAREAGIPEHIQIGTHTCRKTWAYHAYNAVVDLAIIQSALNHSSQRETLRYIGITNDQVDNVYLQLNL